MIYNVFTCITSQYSGEGSVASTYYLPYLLLPTLFTTLASPPNTRAKGRGARARQMPLKRRRNAPFGMRRWRSFGVVCRTWMTRLAIGMPPMPVQISEI